MRQHNTTARSRMQALFSWFVTISMVLQLVPSSALAEAINPADPTPAAEDSAQTLPLAAPNVVVENPLTRELTPEEQAEQDAQQVRNEADAEASRQAEERKAAEEAAAQYRHVSIAFEPNATGDPAAEGFVPVEGQMQPYDYVMDAQPHALPKNEFTRNGYEFAGWATTPDGKDIPDNPETEDVNEFVKATKFTDGFITKDLTWEVTVKDNPDDKDPNAPTHTEQREVAYAVKDDKLTLYAQWKELPKETDKPAQSLAADLNLSTGILGAAAETSVLVGNALSPEVVQWPDDSSASNSADSGQGSEQPATNTDEDEPAYEPVIVRPHTESEDEGASTDKSADKDEADKSTADAGQKAQAEGETSADKRPSLADLLFSRVGAQESADEGDALAGDESASESVGAEDAASTEQPAEGEPASADGTEQSTDGSEPATPADGTESAAPAEGEPEQANEPEAEPTDQPGLTPAPTPEPAPAPAPTLPESAAPADLTSTLATAVGALPTADEPAADTPYTYRLLVGLKPTERVREGDVVLGQHDATVLLGFSTQVELLQAQQHYTMAASWCVVDAALGVAEGEEAPTGTPDPVTAEDNAIELLDSVQAADANPVISAHPLTALVDTGAPEGDMAVVSAVSLVDDDVYDRNGHATRMLATLRAEDAEVRVVSIKALGNDGRGSVSNVYAAILFAVDAGASVINLSLSGLGAEHNDALAEAVAYAADNGCLVVAAAGNGGYDADLFVPGNVAGVLTVGAADAENNVLASSNRGDCVDLYIQADSTSQAAARASGWLTANWGDDATDRLLASALNTHATATEPAPEPEDTTPTDEVETQAPYQVYAVLEGAQGDYVDNTFLMFETSDTITVGATAQTLSDYNNSGTTYACSFVNYVPGFGGATNWLYNITTKERNDQYPVAVRIAPNTTIKPSTMEAAFDFGNSSRVSSIDLTGLDTSVVSNFKESFQRCYKLPSLDLSNLDMSSANNLYDMFWSCDILSSLSLPSSLSKAHPTNMGEMFYGCAALTTLDLSNWDTSSVTSMTRMFYKCTRLTSLNLSGWDTSNASMANMFESDTNLREITLGEKFQFKTVPLNTPSAGRGKWYNATTKGDGVTAEDLCHNYDGGTTGNYARGTYKWDYIYTIDTDYGDGVTYMEDYGTRYIYLHYDHGYYLDYDSSTDTLSNQMSSTRGIMTLPKRTGFSFVGHYTETGGNGTKIIGQNGLLEPVILADATYFTGNTHIYSAWDGDVHTLTLNSKLGEEDPLTTGTTTIYAKNGDGLYKSLAKNSDGIMTDKITSENAIELPTAFGYTFMRYQNNDVVTLINSMGYPMHPNGTINVYFTEDSTLYAYWYGNLYGVRYNANGGSGEMNNSYHRYNTDSNLYANTYTAPSGYTFGGWANSVANAAKGVVYRADKASHGNMASETGAVVDIFAIWYRNISFASGDTSGGNTATTVTVTQYYDGEAGAGASITTPTAANATNITSWSKVGWRAGSAAGTSEVDFNTSTKPTDTTYYAVYSHKASFTSGLKDTDSAGESTTSETVYYSSANKWYVHLPEMSNISTLSWTALGWRADTTATNETLGRSTATDNKYANGTGLVWQFYAVYERAIWFTPFNNNFTDKTWVGPNQYYNSANGVGSSVNTPTLNKSTAYGWAPIGWRTDGTASSEVAVAQATSGDETSVAGVSITPDYKSSETNYYAVYQRTATFTYNGNSGTTPNNTTGTQYLNSRIKTVSGTVRTASSTRTNYKFDGWAVGSADADTKYEANKDVEFPNTAVDSSATVTLYATWWQPTVTFKTGSQSKTQKVNYDANDTLPAVSTLWTQAPVSDNGWGFAGWAKNVNSHTSLTGDAATVKLKDDTIYYAVYKRDITFTYYNSAAATNTTDGTRTQYYLNTNTSTAGLTSVQTFSLTTQSTYKWAPLGWRLDTNNEEAVDNQTGAATTITPQSSNPNHYYAVYQRTAKFTYNGNGATAPSDTTGTQLYNAGGTAASGSVKTANAPTLAGYSFTAWGTGSAGTAPTYSAGETVNPFPNNTWASSNSITLVATWWRPKVTFVTGNKEMGTQVVSYGANTKLNAESGMSNKPVSGNNWTFAGWADSYNTTEVKYNDGANINVTADTKLYAVYKRNITFKYYNSTTATTVTTNTTRVQYWRNTSDTASAATSVETFALYTHSTRGWTPIGWRQDTTANGTAALGGQTGATTTQVTPSPTAAATVNAIYSRTVTFAYNNNGGSTTPQSGTNTQYYNAGNTTASDAKITTAQAITRASYRFNGWGLGSAAGDTYNAGTEYSYPNKAWGSEQTVTLYAKWWQPTVTFKTGNNTMATQEVGNNTATALKKVADMTNKPTLSTDWTFAGWAIASALGTVAYGDGVNITTSDNVTLYAVYQRNVPFVYYASTGATDTTTNNQIQYYRNTTTSAASAQAVSSYPLYTLTNSGDAYNSFAPLGWRTDETAGLAGTNLSQTGATDVLTNIKPPANTTAPTYYAVYSRQASFVSGISGSTTTANATQYHSASKKYTVTTPTTITAINNNWAAKGWRRNTSAAAQQTGAGSADDSATKTFYAVYSRSGTITYAAGGGTGSTGSTTGGTQWYNSGNNLTDVTVTLASNNFTRTGYTFTQWDLGNAGTGYTWKPAVNAAATTTATAQWGANTYTVTFDLAKPNANKASKNDDPTLDNKKNPSDLPATVDTAFTVNAPVLKGYTFTGWKITGMTTDIEHMYGTDKDKAATKDSTAATSFKNLRSGSGTVTFTAQWSPITYKVVYYNANQKMGESTHTYDEAKNLNAYNASGMSNNASKYNDATYNTFYGWAKANNTTGRTYTNSESVVNLSSTNNDTVNLYSIWSRQATFHTVGTNGNTTTSNVAQYGNMNTYSLLVPAIGATVTGWSAQGWRTDTTADTATPVSDNDLKKTTSFTLIKSIGPDFYAVYTRTAYFYDQIGTSGHEQTATQVRNAGGSGASASVYKVVPPSAPRAISVTGVSTDWAAVGWRNDTVSGAGNAILSTGTDAITDGSEKFYAVYQRTPKVTYSGPNANPVSPADQTVPSDPVAPVGNVNATSLPMQYYTTGSSSVSTPSANLAANTNAGFTRTGHTFAGTWLVKDADHDAGVSYATGASYTFTNAVDKASTATAEAMWDRNTYTVTYHPNNGTSEANTTSTHTYDETKALTANTFSTPTRKGAGYSFVGWAKTEARAKEGKVDYTNSQNVKNLATGADTDTNVDLWAVWKRTVTFYSDSKQTTSTSATQAYGSNVTVPGNNKEFDGWLLSGWRTDQTAAAATYNATGGIDPTSDKLYAVYTRTATFYSGVSNASHPTAVQYRNTGTTSAEAWKVTIPGEPTSISTWDAQGWRKDTNAQDKTYGLTGDITAQEGPNFYAVYSRTLTITYDGNNSTGGTQPTATEATQRYNSNGAITDPEFKLRTNTYTRNGYNFVNWQVESDAPVAAGGTYNAWKPAVGDTTTERTAKAQWTPITYNITYVLNQPGTTTPAHGTNHPATYNIETTTFTVSDPTCVGYSFTGWEVTTAPSEWGDGSSESGSKAFKIATGTYGDITLKATWVKNTYTVKFNLNPGSSSTTPTIDDHPSKSPEKWTFDETSPNVSNPQMVGYTFVGWKITDMSNDCPHTYGTETGMGIEKASTKATNYKNLHSGSAAGTETVTFTAQWTPNTYTVNFDLNDVSSTQNPVIDGQGSKANEPWTFDTPYNVNNPSMAGYDFAGWAITGMSTDCDHTYTAGSDITTNRLSQQTTKATGFLNLRSGSGTVTFKALWTPHTYTVTFMHGGQVMDTQTHTYDESIGLKQESWMNNRLTGNGWTFVGWATEPNTSTVGTMNGVRMTDGATVSSLTTQNNANYMLYAIYQRNIVFRHYTSGNALTTTNLPQYYYNTSADAAAAANVQTPQLYASTYGWSPQGWVTSTSATNVASAYRQYTARQINVNPPANAKAPTFYALYSRTATLAYDGVGQNADSPTVPPETKPQILVSTQVATGQDGNDLTFTLATNLFEKTGYTFQKWAAGSTGGTQYNEGETYTFANTAWDSSATNTMYAVWNANKYVVRAEKDATGVASVAVRQNGLTDADNRYAYDSTVAFSANMKAGYSFDGWYHGSDRVTGDNPYNYTVKNTTDYVLTAKATPNKYTVKYDANGGTGAPADQEFTYDQQGFITTDKPTAPAAGSDAYLGGGWVFKGWAISKEDANKGYIYRHPGAAHNNLTTEKNGVVTLYAVWTRTVYFTSGTKQDTTTTSAEQVLNSVPANSSVMVPTGNAGIAGWSLAGWREDTNAQAGQHTADGYLKPTSTVLYAVYSREATFYSGADKAGVRKNPQYRNTGSDAWAVVVPAAPDALATWDALGWRDDTNADVAVYPTTGTITGVVGPSFYAAYSRTLTLAYGSGGGTGTAPTSQTFLQRYNTDGAITYPTGFTLATNTFSRGGYEFDAWDLGNQGALYTDWKPAVTDTIVTRTATAKWKANTYWIYLNLNGGTYASLPDGWTMADASNYNRSYTIETANIVTPTPVWENHVLTEWTVVTAPSGEGITKLADGITPVVKRGSYGEVRLTANWETAYTVHYMKKTPGADAYVEDSSEVRHTASTWNWVDLGNNKTYENYTYKGGSKIKYDKYSDAEKDGGQYFTSSDPQNVTAGEHLYLYYAPETRTVSVSRAAVGVVESAVASAPDAYGNVRTETTADNTNAVTLTAEIGATVTLTATRKAGYMTPTWTASVPLADAGSAGNTAIRTFAMPAAGATASVTSEVKDANLVHFMNGNYEMGNMKSQPGQDTTLRLFSEFGSTNTTPPMDGATFYGWAKTNSSVERAYIDGQTVSNLAPGDDDVYLYAIWQRTVTMYYDGDNPVSTKTAVQLGNTNTFSVELSRISAKSGAGTAWTTLGWRTDEAAGAAEVTTTNGEAMTLRENLGPNFYAVYSRQANFYDRVGETAANVRHATQFASASGAYSVTPPSAPRAIEADGVPVETDWEAVGWRSDSVPQAEVASVGTEAINSASQNYYAVYKRPVYVDYEAPNANPQGSFVPTGSMLAESQTLAGTQYYNTYGGETGGVTSVAAKLAGNKFSREGYTFAQWLVDEGEYKAGESYNFVNTVKTTNHVEADAMWSRNNYAITLNNGVPAGSLSTYKAGANTPTSYYTDMAASVSDPSLPGYTFGGWNVVSAPTKWGAGYGRAQGSTSFSIPVGTYGAIELQAVWEPVDTTYTVKHWIQSVDDDKAYTLSATENFTAQTDTKVTPLQREIPGYQPRDGVVETQVRGDGTTVVNYYYDRIEYTVTFIVNSIYASGTMADQKFKYLEPEGTLRENAFESDELTFRCWNTKADGSGTSYNDQTPLKSIRFSSDDVTDDTRVVLYAQWRHAAMLVAMFDGDTLTFFYTPDEIEAESGTWLTGVRDMTGSVHKGTIYVGLDDSEYESKSEVPWNEKVTSVKKVVVLGTDGNPAPKSTAYWFAGMTNLEFADLEHLDTALNCIDMAHMFDDCDNLNVVRLGETFRFRGANVDTIPLTRLPGLSEDDFGEPYGQVVTTWNDYGKEVHYTPKELAEIYDGNAAKFKGTYVRDREVYLPTTGGIGLNIVLMWVAAVAVVGAVIVLLRRRNRE